MRIEVNISLREISQNHSEQTQINAETPHHSVSNPRESALGTKVEVKNINSFKFVEKALEYEIKRVQLAKMVDKIVVATTVNQADDKIENFCRQIGVDCWCGLEEDVLDRYYQCALKYPEYQNIIRLTGDCPLIDPAIIDKVIKLFLSGQFDYASNIDPETFPDGLDVEIFSRRALEISAQEAKLMSEREHVTQYIRKNDKFKKINLTAPRDFSKFRLTVDNAEDLEVVKFLIEKSSFQSGYLDYVGLLEKNSDILAKNSHIERNEGLKKSLAEDYSINK